MTIIDLKKCLKSCLQGLTEGMERDWMKTLAALKTKDPIIYQKDAHFYRDQGTLSL